MDPRRWTMIEELFRGALDLPPEEREQLLQNRSGQDEELAGIVREMLIQDASSSFLDAGAAALGASIANAGLPTLLGPYLLEQILGQGGMGVVYRAEHIEWRISAAVKVPSDVWISPDRKERFLAEQRVLAQLIHPSIARIYESGTTPAGTPWFAMEFVEGEPVTVHARSRSLSLEDRLTLFLEACNAVLYAHSQGIIHRDLKPSNIYVTAADGQVKLLDFGIAKQLEENSVELTRSGAHPFTVAYAAPEQMSGNRVSFQSDVYSLGVILYELLAGRLPFDVAGLSPSQAEQLISTRTPDPPSALSSLPAKRSRWSELDLLLQKALHKDLSQRYASAEALVRDVNHFLRQQPLDAKPDATFYRVRKFVERRRVPVFVALSIVLLLGCTIAYFTWNLERAKDAALKQAARERQIQQFMTDLFEGGDEINGPSKDLRVIDMLDTGVKKARRFDNDPAVQADLYGALGTVYLSVGELDKAGKLLYLALARANAAFGIRSEEAADAKMYLQTLEYARGHYATAEGLAREALSITQHLSKPEPVKVARYSVAVASDLIEEGRDREGLALLQQAASFQQNDRWHQDFWLENLNLQAVAFRRLHQYREAEARARSLIQLDRRLHGRFEFQDANDFELLGKTQQAQLRFSEAEESFRQAVSVLRAWRPDSDPAVAEGRLLLAADLVEEGRFSEADSLSRSLPADFGRSYGEWHPLVALAFGVRSRLDLNKGRLPEASDEARRELAIDRKVNADLDLPVALATLADIDLKRKDFRSAESEYVQAESLFRKTDQTETEAYALAELDLGRLRISQHRYAQAEAPLSSSLAFWQEYESAGNSNLAATLALLKTVSK